MIPMDLAGVRMELPSNQPIVLLKEQGGERFLPIWIGAAEAAAIAFALQGIPTPRPMTHDLMKEVLDQLGVHIDRVSITELREGTFYALLHLSREERSWEISSRPSDAIALAVRAEADITAAEEVLDEASILIPSEEQEEEQEVERFREFLEDVTPEDFA